MTATIAQVRAGEVGDIDDCVWFRPLDVALSHGCGDADDGLRSEVDAIRPSSVTLDLAAQRVFALEVHVGEALVHDHATRPGVSSVALKPQTTRRDGNSDGVEVLFAPALTIVTMGTARVRICPPVDETFSSRPAPPPSGKLLAVVTASGPDSCQPLSQPPCETVRSSASGITGDVWLVDLHGEQARRIEAEIEAIEREKLRIMNPAPARSTSVSATCTNGASVRPAVRPGSRSTRNARLPSGPR